MTKFADLHIHTHYSDSTLSPQEVVQESIKAKLACIGITDHDCIAGVAQTQQAAEESGLEVIAGVELSSEIEGKDVHILGYFVDIVDQDFNSELSKMQEHRILRIKKMVECLNQLGMKDVDFHEVLNLTKSNAVGRPHLAAVLKEKGKVSSMAEAFTKYIGEGCPAYVPKYKRTPFEAIKLVRKAGGVAVLAHPVVTNKDELIPSFVEAGLQGLEVYYPNYSNTTIKHYLGIARKHHLAVTGGSDAHGDAKTNSYVGKAQVPYQYVIQLKELRNGKLN